MLRFCKVITIMSLFNVVSALFCELHVALLIFEGSGLIDGETSGYYGLTSSLTFAV